MNALFTYFGLAALLVQFALVPSLSAQGFGNKKTGEEKINLDPLTVESIETPEYKIGESSEFKIYFDLASGHHAYIDQFKVEIESPNYIYISEVEVSPVVDFIDPVTKKKKKGTEGHGSLKTYIQISKEELDKNPALKNRASLPVNLFLTYQACTKTYCLFPKKIPLQTTLKLSGTVATTVPSGALLSFEDALSRGLLATFLIVFFAGILTSFTPCIFPMIPITLAVLGAQQLKGTAAKSSRSRSFILSLFYVLGIAITYSIVGVIAAKTGALFGSFLGHPMVVTAIALIFVAMAFSMFGFYEVKIPDSLATKISNKFSSASGEKNFIGAFLSGIVAGVVASPCVGPVLVSILTYVAQTQNTVLGFFLLFTFALGLGQIFIVMGTFSHLLNKLPRSGNWLNGVKYVFGTVMLLMAVYYVLPILPKDKILNQLGISKEETGTESYLKPKWLPYSEENLAKAKEAGMPVIIDVKADWCLACKELEMNTFSHKEVHDLGKRFIWLEFDATQNSPALDALKEKYTILGLPFVAFIS
ncbi:MAG: cytochrome c biogenesis protein CcdA, partial [Bdellovibrionota bacterium]